MITIHDCGIRNHILPVDVDASCYSLLNASAPHWNAIDQPFDSICYETFCRVFLSKVPSIILQLDIKRKKEYIY